jgi:RNA polymerase primary sigma factor
MKMSGATAAAADTPRDPEPGETRDGWPAVPGACAWDLIEAHRNELRWLARGFRHFGVPLEDLESEGLLGLIEAAGRYDGARGTQFFSYAAFWVRKRLRECVIRQYGIVPLPASDLRRLRKVRLAERDLEAALRRRPKVDEIAESSGVSEDDVERLRRAARREISLDQAVCPGSRTCVSDFLRDVRTPAPDAEIEQASEKAALLRALDLLPARYREVVSLRFGLDGDRPRRLSEIARTLGVSRERVRQIEELALKRMRSSLGDEGCSAPRPDRPAARSSTSP